MKKVKCPVCGKKLKFDSAPSQNWECGKCFYHIHGDIDTKSFPKKSPNQNCRLEHKKFLELNPNGKKVKKALNKNNLCN